MFIQAEGYIHCCDWRNNSQDMNRMNSRNVLYRDDININMVLILLLLLLLLLDIGISHISKPNASRHHQLPTVRANISRQDVRAVTSRPLRQPEIKRRSGRITNQEVISGHYFEQRHKRSRRPLQDLHARLILHQ